MYASALLLLALPACLRVTLAEYTADFEQALLSGLCPEYTHYAVRMHKPLSTGPLQLPAQRPHPSCRLYTSSAVDEVIDDLRPHFKDPDLARLFENAFPNTLDTTVRWHTQDPPKSQLLRDRERWKGSQSFIVTGDINAEWLRDSTNQLSQYQRIPELKPLLLGAVHTQVEYILQSPYCNAFQPPSPSGLKPTMNGQDDVVHPAYEPSVVFECKYELDSLANFLSLSNQFATHHDNSHLTHRWFKALATVMAVVDEQSAPTFAGGLRGNEYTFSRKTTSGTETLNLGGLGNPLANGTNLVRSAFRPSDDATTFGFLIPANAMLSVELNRTAAILHSHASSSVDAAAISSLAARLAQRAQLIREGIFKHAVVNDVFAYEIDGYGSHLFMDDANVPSLLSLPLLGFVSKDDPIYLNTRRKILSSANPYYLSGPHFSGIGGPHIGLQNAWPMSVLVQALTTDDEDEIMDCLNRVKNISVFGLINESVNVETGVDRATGDGMTRSWFAWANSVFAQVILTLAEERPSLILDTKRSYVVGKGFIDLKPSL